MAAEADGPKTLDERLRLIEDRFEIYNLIASHPPFVMFASNTRFLLFDYFRTPYVKKAGSDALTLASAKSLSRSGAAFTSASVAAAGSALAAS